MKTMIKPLAYLMVTLLLGISGLSSAQSSNADEFRPQSSIERPEQIGLNAHTHLHVLIPLGGQQEFNAQINTSVTPLGLPPKPGVFYETPASLACVYGLEWPVLGCNPQTITTVPTGGSRAIALVDAFSYPTALSDLQYFSNQFGLASPDLTVVYANGTPSNNEGWALEAALDLQWSHAMAPYAKLYLVLAKNNSIGELLKAVDKASSLVAANGGGQVSMSWGSSEFSGESAYDSHFNTQNVVYISSAGDSPGTSWPAISPNVIGVGGTSITRNPVSGNFLQEVVWPSTGGGLSLYYPRPSYQNANALAGRLGNQRGSPDVASAADPASGGWVYYTSLSGNSGWLILGGTSWSAVTFAGIVNASGNFPDSSATALNQVYADLGTSFFRDIAIGSCGNNAAYLSAVGWDFCTGVGSFMGFLPVGNSGYATNGFTDVSADYCLFNWAEQNYAYLFSPSGVPNAYTSIYNYRYYPLTNNYLGVSTVDNHVYFMSGSNGILQDEGPIAYWLPNAGCQ